MQSISRVTVIGGAGHVGLPLALALAERGFQVDVLDVNEKALAAIAQGKMPFIEHGADELLAKILKTGRLNLTSENRVVAQADVVICVIGTPVDEYLNPETYLFYKVIGDLRPHLRDGQTLILRSTVYPGLSAKIDRMFREEGPRVHVAFCPERVAQGQSLREIHELPQIISAFDDVGLAAARTVFGRISRELIEVVPLEAELAKLMCNCYRYITFAIANQFHMIATDAGVDFNRVHHAATHNNPRTSTMPRPGLAAGPCLFKDTMQLAAFSNNNFFLGHAAMLINEGLPQYMVNTLKGKCDLHKMKAGILGMTFKADCDDIRDSLSFKLKKLLQLEAKAVLTHDPYLKSDATVEQILNECDVIVVGTPHKEYRGLKIPAGKIVEDVWNCLGK